MPRSASALYIFVLGARSGVPSLVLQSCALANSTRGAPCRCAPRAACCVLLPQPRPGLPAAPRGSSTPQGSRSPTGQQKPHGTAAAPRAQPWPHVPQLPQHEAAAHSVLGTAGAGGQAREELVCGKDGGRGQQRNEASYCRRSGKAWGQVLLAEPLRKSRSSLPALPIAASPGAAPGPQTDPKSGCLL